MDIRGITTDEGAVLLKGDIKKYVKDFIIIVSDNVDNAELEKLVQSSSTRYEDIKNYVKYESSVDLAAHDTDGLVTFKLVLPYEPDFGGYIYGLGLIDDNKTLLSLSKTPKIAKITGLGGIFTYKIDITGTAGEIIFNNSNCEFATKDESIAGILDYKSITPASLTAKLATQAEAFVFENNTKVLTPAILPAQGRMKRITTLDELIVPASAIRFCFIDGRLNPEIAPDNLADVFTVFTTRYGSSYSVYAFGRNTPVYQRLYNNGKWYNWANLGGRALLNANGYTKLPSGLIIQWGRFVTNGGWDTKIIFPIAFPQVCQVVTVTPDAQTKATGVTYAAEAGVRYRVNDGFYGGTVGVGVTCTYTAIGY